MVSEVEKPDSYYLIPLIKRKDLTESCINLLNQEWPRSHTVRAHSMARSTSEVPPMSFLLLQRSTDNLVGHLRLCRLLDEPSGCWVESVIVDSQYRNKGLGKLLMEKVEKYAGEFGFQKIYLSTKDKQGFYAKCGYHLCQPVVHVGSAKLPVVKGLVKRLSEDKDTVAEDTASALQQCHISRNCTTTSPCASVPPPPPPPPSQSLKKCSENVAKKNFLAKNSKKPSLLPSQYMCKVLV